MAGEMISRGEADDAASFADELAALEIAVLSYPGVGSLEFVSCTMSVANRDAVVSVLHAHDELVEALKAIKDATDADNPESYRCDDREGCLDTVFDIAVAALARAAQED